MVTSKFRSLIHELDSNRILILINTFFEIKNKQKTIPLLKMQLIFCGHGLWENNCCLVNNLKTDI